MRENKYKTNSAVLYQLSQLSDSMRTLIETDNPLLQPEDYIPVERIIEYRKKYLAKLIDDERGEIDVLEKSVLDAISNSKILSENIEPEIEDKLTGGQKMADKIAEFGGSWKFIISFFVVIMIWISFNVYSSTKFDLYPFILLNLILSCVAALQAPVIMMSQNRLETRDRLRNESDYMINLKAELEIRQLHMKIDLLLKHQWQRMLEIQQIQFELIESLHNIKK